MTTNLITIECQSEGCKSRSVTVERAEPHPWLRLDSSGLPVGYFCPSCWKQYSPC